MDSSLEEYDLKLLNDRDLKELERLTPWREKFEHLTEEEERRMQYRATLEASPAAFFREAWRILEPGKDITWSWHYELIGEYLHACYLRQIKRLIINVPYRTAKSSEVTITWPAWCWAVQPTLRFVTASYSSELSGDHSSNRRRLMESNWYQDLWPTELARDTNRRDQYRNTKEGEMIATSVGATATGRGGDILILDDAMSADDARSTAKQKALHDWFPNTFRSRLDDPDKGVIVVIEQRTSDKDMTGWLLANEPDQWTHIAIPTECEQVKEYSFPISGQKLVREIGDVLQPTRHTPAVIASRKIHARTWATQDQQRPAPDSGVVFKRDWFKFIDTAPANTDMAGTSWDLAVEGKADSDFNCGIYWRKKGADFYVLDVHKKRLPFPHQVTAVKEFGAKHPDARRHLVEKKANGPAVIATVSAVLAGVIAVEPQGSKLQRADAASADCESGNVYILAGQEWTLDFIESLIKFPNGVNDDDVDAFTQAVNWCRGHNFQYGLLALAEREAKQTAAAREEYMKGANQMVKPDMPAVAPACPKCKSTIVRRIGGVYQCNNGGCRNQWPATAGAKIDSTPYMRK